MCKTLTTVVEMATPVPAEDGLFAVLMPNGTRHPSGLTSELERAEAVARELWGERWDVTVARMQLRLDAFRAERGAS